jgi:hypothetical protein
MSSERDLERLLEEAGKTVPEPDEEATERARKGAHAAFRRARPRRPIRVAVLLGVCLAVAVVLGVAASAFVAPSGTASRGPVGLGFVPQPGWFAFQTGGETSALYQTVAVASNAPLHPEDQVAGSADPSGLPYATLLELPPEGIVIVATFTREVWSPIPLSNAVEELELPLRMRDAAPYVRYGTQIRPDDPLGQYEISGLLNRHQVNVHVYFGTSQPSSALLAEADRQLRGIVVRRAPASAAAVATRPATSAAPAAPAILDRTFACAPAYVGGARQIDALARGGSGRRGSSWNSPAFASVVSTVSGAAATAVENNLVWVTAGAPSATATVVETMPGFTFPFRSWGTVAVSRGLCRPSTQRVALSKKGLQGGAVGVFDEAWDCVTGRRVLVRVRAVVESATKLASFRGYLRTTVPVKSAKLVVATPAGKTLAYAQVFSSGESLLYVAKGCFPE